MQWVRERALLVWLVGAMVCGPAGAVTVEPGIVYAQATVHAHTTPVTTNLLLDVYRPDNLADANGNALVLVHGGGFTSGDRTSPDMVDAGMYFAARGWVCFSIDYRLEPDDPPAPAWIEALGIPWLNAVHAAMVDTKRAIRWVRANAGTYACASNRVAGLGHSAGAYCVVQVSITDEQDFANDAGSAVPDQLPAYAGKLNAGIEVSGGLGTGAPEVDAADAPLMIWHGDADATVPYAEAETLYAACTANRLPVRSFALAGKDHGAATWTALYDGRGLKEHALEFLDLFFGLNIDIATSPAGATLSWPSVSNAVYEVRATSDLDQPFTNALSSTVTSVTDACTALVPGLPAKRFFQLQLRSGQEQ